MHDPARLFRALADETRLQMLALISQHGELCVCDLENVIEIGQSKASRHLRYLLNAGLLKDRRSTVWIYYRIAEDLHDAQKAILNGAEKLIDPARMRDLNSKLAKWRQEKECGATRDKSSGKVVTAETLV
jgi:ArsR family transcriptional regulator, arsenate/arsenite/antimonite-responsive transcriptional repressor